MDDLIKSFNCDQDRYEYLLFERDHVLKEADQILTKYKIEFGKQITELFEIKIKCIKAKKTIAHYQKALAGDGQVNVSKLEQQLAREMQVYSDQLKAMLAENEALKNCVQLTPHESKRIKELYYVLAKKIHPDLNPSLADDPVIADLWAQIQTAYIHNDVKKLAELTVQVNKVLKDLDMQGFTDLEIPDIKEKIEELEEEIHRIKNSAPYTFIEFFKDDASIKAKHDEIKEQIDNYTKYLEQLQSAIDQMLKNGGITLIWMGNSQ